MRRPRSKKDLRGSAPDHDEPVTPVLFLEHQDVFANFLGDLTLVGPGLFVRAIQPGHVFRVESGRHRPYGREFVLDRIQVFCTQDPSVHRTFIRVVRDRIPSSEDDVVQAHQSDEILDEGRSVIGPLTQSDRIQLGQTPDGLGQPHPGEMDPSDGGGGHGPHTGKQDTEASFGRSYLRRSLRHFFAPR